MNANSAVEISLFDALPGETDVTCTQHNIGGVNFKLSNTTELNYSPASNDTLLHLTSFLVQHPEAFSPNAPATDKLLVLECGTGLGGIASLKQGWKCVTFADASAEMLLQSTWPNVYLNCPENMAAVKCIQAGSWGTLSPFLTSPDAANR